MAAPALAHKLQTLRDTLSRLGSVLVCFSGGVDSALLLAVAHQQLGDKAVGLTAASPSLAPSELQRAVRLARAIGAEHHVVESREMDDPNYVCNDENRCFFCKTELYRLADEKRREWQLAAVIDGSNVDDGDDYRPGSKAADQANVLRPLIETGFNKQDVRQAARSLGLEVWDQPASACLASRVPYGTQITAEILTQIADFEAALHELGFSVVRVRHHGDVARIELSPAELALACESEKRQCIVRAGRTVGFRHVALDLAGYRRGSHNEALPPEVLNRG